MRLGLGVMGGDCPTRLNWRQGQTRKLDILFAVLEFVAFFLNSMTGKKILPLLSVRTSVFRTTYIYRILTNYSRIT